MGRRRNVWAGRRWPVLGLGALVAVIAGVVAVVAFGGSSPAGSAGATSSASSGSSASSESSASGSPVASASKTCAATPALTEGPYYKAGAPKRSKLTAAGTVGTRLVLRGRVLSTACKPVKRAKIDVWQADGNGNYDNAGYRLRGYLYTNGNGRYRIETVVPGLYPGRTEHIHVKVTPPGGTTVTTQLFFPGVTQNDGDGIYNAKNLVKLTKSKPKWKARFDFVVAA